MVLLLSLLGRPIAPGARFESEPLTGAASRARRGFHLSKWYLDVVGNDGRAFLAYSGRARVRGISLSYGSVLLVPPDGPSCARSTAIGCAEPEESDGALRWASRRLGVTGSWRALAAPVSRRLLGGPRGEIHWYCRAPVALARVELRGQTEMRGSGYVERLEMTIAPWHLPIDELRWGRFHAAASYLLWIDWRGPSPMTLVVRDGVVLNGAVVGDSEIRLPDGATLMFSRVGTLREGPAVPGAFARLLPRLASWREFKWLSRGVLTASGTKTDGWAIHEKVDLLGESS